MNGRWRAVLRGTAVAAALACLVAAAPSQASVRDDRGPVPASAIVQPDPGF